MKGIVIDGFRMAMKHVMEAEHLYVASISCSRFPIARLRIQLPERLVQERGLRFRLRLHRTFRLAGYAVAAHDLRLSFSDHCVFVYAKPRWTLHEHTLKEIIEGRVCPT